MPSGVNPVKRTEGFVFLRLIFAVARPTSSRIRLVAIDISVPLRRTNGTVVHAALFAGSFSSCVELRTEFGIHISLPPRSLMIVWRHVISLTRPDALPTFMLSPGEITWLTISVKPPIRLEIVSFIPKESASPPTPRAVRSVLGVMPKTGLSTTSTARNHNNMRRKLMNSDALGRFVLSKALVASLAAILMIKNATIKVTAR